MLISTTPFLVTFSTASSRKNRRTEIPDPTAAIARVRTCTKLLKLPREAMRARDFIGPSTIPASGKRSLADEADDQRAPSVIVLLDVPEKDMTRVAAPGRIVLLCRAVGRQHLHHSSGRGRSQDPQEPQDPLGACHPPVVHGRREGAQGGGLSDRDHQFHTRSKASMKEPSSWRPISDRPGTSSSSGMPRSSRSSRTAKTRMSDSCTD